MRRTNQLFLLIICLVFFMAGIQTAYVQDSKDSNFDEKACTSFVAASGFQD